MIIVKSIAIIFCLVLVTPMLTPAAHAAVWSQRTKMHFNQPIEIPGKILPSGNYWFVVFDSQSDRNVIQIFDSAQKTLYATLLTIPTERRQWNLETEVVFAEREHSQPEALWKWYYLGLTTGHEFLYPASEQQQLIHDEKQVVMIPETGKGTAQGE
jgi:hypothetical protein